MRDNPSTFFARTFHPDEANQAFTAGRLLETGRYEYRPDDHHGPTLYYAAAAIQKSAGHNTLATLDGTLLRCTPLLFAILALVFGFLAVRKLLKPAMGKLGSWLVPGLFALLLGTSPIFVFFATDFIQEMLLACFTLMMFWAGVGYFKVLGTWCLVPSEELKHNNEDEKNAPKTKLKPGTWALLFGISAGLAFATKETSLITFAAAGIAGLILKSLDILTRHKAVHDLKVFKVLNSRDVILASAGFFLTAILFYSSFAANWQGVFNAFIAAPLSYVHRAAGDAASTGAGWHVHPWWQYLKWLFASDWKFSAFPIAAIFLVTFKRHSFVHIYGIILLVLYSLIPYKTPWCALQLLLPIVLAPFIVPRTKTTSFIALPLAILSLATNVIGDIAIARDPDSKDIPYNYAAASPEVKQLAATVAAAMEVPGAECLVPGASCLVPSAELKHQDLSESNAPSTNYDAPSTKHQAPFIAVALPPSDTWPFPWYNRPYEPQTGYWTSFDDLKQLAAGGVKPTVVIVPMTEGHLVQPLFPHLKHTKRFYMRPGVRVRVFW